MLKANKYIPLKIDGMVGADDISMFKKMGPFLRELSFMFGEVHGGPLPVGRRVRTPFIHL